MFGDLVAVVFEILRRKTDRYAAENPTPQVSSTWIIKINTCTPEGIIIIIVIIIIVIIIIIIIIMVLMFSKRHLRYHQFVVICSQ